MTCDLSPPLGEAEARSGHLGILATSSLGLEHVLNLAIGQHWSPTAVTHIVHSIRASNEGSRRFHNNGEGPRLKEPTRAFIFKTLLRHYAKQALTHGIK